MCNELKDAEQRQPPDVAFAETQLRVALPFIPALRALDDHAARAGVRAIPPRTALGANPLAGRAHSAAGQTNVWFAGGFGSRGLLYHALIAKWLVEAADQGDASRLPDEVRRGEFAAMLIRKLNALKPRPQGQRWRRWRRLL